MNQRTWRRVAGAAALLLTASRPPLDAAAQKSSTTTSTTTTTTTTAAPASTGAAGARLAQLKKDIDAILSARGVSRATWGIAVKSLGNRTIYSSGADKLLLPASNMKVITLAAAAERLG